jgi:hypothetical protein
VDVATAKLRFLSLLHCQIALIGTARQDLFGASRYCRIMASVTFSERVNRANLKAKQTSRNETMPINFYHVSEKLD